jgi:hypothetical protein
VKVGNDICKEQIIITFLCPNKPGSTVTLVMNGGKVQKRVGKPVIETEF